MEDGTRRRQRPFELKSGTPVTLVLRDNGTLTPILVVFTCICFKLQMLRTGKSSNAISVNQISI